MKNSKRLFQIGILLFLAQAGNVKLQAQNGVNSQTSQVVTNDQAELEKLRLAVEKNPGNIDAHNAYTKAYRLHLRRKSIPDLSYETLEKQYQEWMNKFPRVAVIPYAIGNAFSGAESPKAKTWLLKAIAIDPNYAPTYMALSSDAERWGDFEGGRKYLSTAARVDPSNPDYAFYNASNFADIDLAKYKEMTLDVVRNFPGHERAAQALYWLAYRVADEKEKRAIWERLRTEFPPSKFGWSSSGMTSYFDHLLVSDPTKALELAREMAKLQPDGSGGSSWATQVNVAENLVEVKKLSSQNRPVEALAVLNNTRLSKYSSAADEFAILKAKTVEATGNTQAAYDSIVTHYAKNPSEQVPSLIKQLSKEFNKTDLQLQEDIAKVRYATAQPATPFTLEQYFKPGKVSLSDFKGKVVLITYWFPGCGPCRGEFPHFENVVRKFKGKDFEYIGLNIVEEQDDYVIPFVKNSGYSFIPLRDQKGRNKGNLDNRGLAPVNFLLDKEGKVIFSWFRTDHSNERTLELMINSLLTGKAI